MKIGQLLVNKKLITPEQLQAALGEHEKWGSRLGVTLVRMGFLDEEDLVRALAGQLRLPVARIKGKNVKDDVLELVPGDLAEKYHCLPLFMREEAGSRVLFVAMEDPSDLEAIDDLAFQVGEKIRAVLVAPTELDEAIHRHYHAAAKQPASGAAGLGPLGAARTGSPGDTGDDTAEQTDSTAPDLPPLQHSEPLASSGSLGTTPLAEPGPSPSVVKGLFEERDPSESMFDMGPPPDLTADESTAPNDLPPLPEPSASRAGARPRTDGSGGLEPRVILRALSQLLVEKGVISREELAQRLRQLAAQESSSSS